MAKINSDGKIIENELWDAGNDSIDEEEIFEDGEKGYQNGKIPDDNPWPKESYAYNVWLDGFWSQI